MPDLCCLSLYICHYAGHVGSAVLWAQPSLQAVSQVLKLLPRVAKFPITFLLFFPLFLFPCKIYLFLSLPPGVKQMDESTLNVK